MGFSPWAIFRLALAAFSRASARTPSPPLQTSRAMTASGLEQRCSDHHITAAARASNCETNPVAGYANMTSLQQIESNRRNAQKSTGPKTPNGKARASQNAVRHGLTAETVIGPLEDPADYRAFEQAVTTAYDAETAVERELVLRLASLLWRLRRATSVETGLLEMQCEASTEPDPALPGLRGDRNLPVRARFEWQRTCALLSSSGRPRQRNF